MVRDRAHPAARCRRWRCRRPTSTPWRRTCAACRRRPASRGRGRASRATLPDGSRVEGLVLAETAADLHLLRDDGSLRAVARTRRDALGTRSRADAHAHAASHAAAARRRRLDDLQRRPARQSPHGAGADHGRQRRDTAAGLDVRRPRRPRPAQHAARRRRRDVRRRAQRGVSRSTRAPASRSGSTGVRARRA